MKKELCLQGAPSFLRFVSYEIFSARQDLQNILKTLGQLSTQNYFYPH